MKLFFSALSKFLLGVLLVGGLLFLSAGTTDFFGAWLFMGVLFVPMLLAGIVLIFKNPELLKRRLDAKEKQNKRLQN